MREEGKHCKEVRCSIKETLRCTVKTTAKLTSACFRLIILIACVRLRGFDTLVIALCY